MPHEELAKDPNGPSEPELIMNNSKIILNGKHMEMVSNQWSRRQFHSQCEEKLKGAAVEDVHLEFFRASSSGTLNKVLQEVAEKIPQGKVFGGIFW